MNFNYLANDSSPGIRNASPRSMNNYDSNVGLDSIDEEENQRLEAREPFALNSNDVLCGRGKTSFNHGKSVQAQLRSVASSTQCRLYLPWEHWLTFCC